MKRYPIDQRNQTKQSYTPSFEKNDYQYGTINTNVDDTKMNPTREYTVVE